MCAGNAVFSHTKVVSESKGRRCETAVAAMVAYTKTTGGACNQLADLGPLVSPLQVIYIPRKFDLAGL